MGIMDQSSRIFKETEDVWTPYKELYLNISSALSPNCKKPLSFLEDLLRVHKNTFINLLKNAPKDEKCRAEIRNYATKSCPGPGRSINVTEQLYQETCILSDLFECNEYIALDLLCMAEHQLPSYPGLTRGLVAVLLYYDGRSAICDTLCLLAQARSGISWQLEVSQDVGKVIGAFMDQLVSINLLGNILELLEKTELSKELSKLQQNRGLGGPKHQHKVTALINKTRQSLADTVFCLAAQAGLPHEPMMRLIKFLANTKLELDGTGVIDGVTLALQMALLYALDVSVVHRREDGEEHLQKLPLLCEKNLVRELMQQLASPRVTWQCRGLQSVTQLAWGLSICSLRSAPVSLRPHKFEVEERDDDLVNFALDDRVFEFMYRTMLPHPAFTKEEFYLRRMHTLLTDFIILMPIKVKDLKNEADVVAKTMQSYNEAGLRAPTTLSRNFEHFLLCMASLYMRDELGLELSMEFWSLPESSQSLSSSLMVRAPQAQTTLNKFMQSVGDMLPPAMFVPYLKLLAALAKGPRVSKDAFTLLNSGGTISWEHFFKAMHRYSSNLHQELAPAPTDSVYRTRATPRGINPIEIPGLHAVLSLIRTVAEHDPIARVVLAEDPAWDAIHTILGLVKCSVPVPLKADLLLTLAALAKNPHVATEIWQKLEMSGVLATVPSTSNYQPRGIQSELEEVEARNEEFPLSRAMVTLLSSLTEATSLPLVLGIGRRTPGLEPYLHFVVDCLFLRFMHRAYRRPEEKWEVAEVCLGWFVQLLNLYEPRAEFVEGVKLSSDHPGAGPKVISPPPGHSILIMLNCNSELLKKVLHVLDEACLYLEHYQPFPGKASLEKAALHCLTLLQQGLVKGPKLAKLISECTSGVTLPLLTGLDKLILGINPRSGHIDHPINISKFLSFSEWLPNHALLSVKVLTQVAQTPKCQNQLLQIFADAQPSGALMNTFVECLDEIVTETPTQDPTDKATIIGQIKEEIASFLLQCLSFQAPTLSHLLLGFNTKRPLKETLLQHAGVLNYPRTCLHSILGLLDKSLPPGANRFQPVDAGDSLPYMQSPKLMEKCMAILYALCVNPETARPTFRYLRACSDFLARHLQCINSAIMTGTASTLSCSSWVLRCVAIDMKLCSGDRQRSALNALLQPLLATPTEFEATLELTRLKTTDPALTGTSMRTEHPLQNRELLARLLQSVSFVEPTIPAPAWHFMEHNSLVKLLEECVIKEGSLAGMINVAWLNQRLQGLLADNLNSSALGQRTAMSQEMKDVLSYATKLNEARGVARGSLRVVEAWRQVAVVLFMAAPADLMSPLERHNLLLLITKVILAKMEGSGGRVCPEISSVASSSLLLLLQALRQGLMRMKSESCANEEPNSTTSDNKINIDVPTIRSIIAGLVHWLRTTPPTNQMVRANLYGSLVTFLYATCFDATEAEKLEAEKGLGGSFSSMYVRQLDRNPHVMPGQEKSTLSQRRAGALSELTIRGEILLSALCSDAIGGHDVCRMLAYSTISVLVRLGPEANWAMFMCRHGFLQNMIQSLAKNDQQLSLTLKPVPTTLKPLYVYESLMTLLCRMAMSRSQAEMLLRYQLLTYLTGMTTLDCHPYPLVPVPNAGTGELLPSVTERYQQILLPALLACDAALCSLPNPSCIEAVIHFMSRHEEALSMVLRGGSPLLSSSYLQELRLVLSLLARVAAEPPAMLESACAMAKLRQLALSLLPRFIVTGNLINQLRAKAKSEEKEDVCVLLILRITVLLLTLSRRLAHSHSGVYKLVRPVFKPSADETESEMADINFSTMSVASTNLMRAPDMGLLLGLLEEAALLSRRLKEERDREKQRLSIMDSLPANQRRDKEELEGDFASSRKRLWEKVQRREDEVTVLARLIEQCLHLLWAHLDLYFRRNLPQPGHPCAESLLESRFRPSLQDLVGLKDAILNKFTEMIERHSRDALQEETEQNQLFVSMLIRRIKRLVQFVPI